MSPHGPTTSGAHAGEPVQRDGMHALLLTRARASKALLLAAAAAGFWLVEEPCKHGMACLLVQSMVRFVGCALPSTFLALPKGFPVFACSPHWGDTGRGKT